MKKTNNGSTTCYEFDSMSKQSAIVVKNIIKGFIEANIEPQDVMAILGDACLRILVVMADDLGYDKNEIAEVFGNGIATAKLEFED